MMEDIQVGTANGGLGEKGWVVFCSCYDTNWTKGLSIGISYLENRWSLLCKRWERG